MDEKITITPDTKLGKLLENYPQLEDELISISPTYSKLKNPILRKTVGKVASLRQVAVVGEIPVADLINQLRKKVGICEEFVADNVTEKNAEKPDWIKADRIAKTLDAQPIIESGGHPLEQVMKEMVELENGKIYELITPFVPSPLLDVVRKKGYQVWSETVDDNVVKNYFVKL
jgi:hypothetical protein